MESQNNQKPNNLPPYQDTSWMSNHHAFAYMVLGIVVVASILMLYRAEWRRARINTDFPVHQAQTSATDGWASYSNTEYDYSFKFPNGEKWGVQLTGPDPAPINQSASVALTDGKDSLHVEMRIPPAKRNAITPEMYVIWSLPLEDYAKRIWQDNKDDIPNKPGKMVGDLQTFSLDGQTSYRFTLTNSYVSDEIGGGHSLDSQEYLIVATAKDGVKYFISLPNTRIWQQVLSTFKFGVSTTTPFVSLKSHGGLCVTGAECESTFSISEDGRLAYFSGGKELDKGALTSSELSNLKNLVATTNFSTLRPRDNDYVCPIAYDGPEHVFTFYIARKIQTVASCTYDTEGYGLFQYLIDLRSVKAF